MYVVRKILNLMSELNLKETTLDFLEILSNKRYELLSNDKSFPISVVNNSPILQGMMKNHEFDFGSFKNIDLANPTKKTTKVKTLESIQRERVSSRTFEGVLNFTELSQLLSLIYNQTEVKKNNKRNIASGGGIYPVELFFFNNRIADIPKGIYYYNLYRKRVELIKEFSLMEKDTFISQTFLTDFKSDMDYYAASIFLFPVALINKASFKYGDLAVKLAIIDGGAIIQNAYLASSAMKIKTVACAGYVDSPVKDALGLKRVYQHIVSSVLIGK